MIVTFILLLMLSIRPLYIYGKEAYIGLKSHDYSKLKANLLFFGITGFIIVGLAIIFIKN